MEENFTEKINLVALRGMEAYFYYRLYSAEDKVKNVFIPSVSGKGDTSEQYEDEVTEFLCTHEDTLYWFKCAPAEIIS